MQFTKKKRKREDSGSDVDLDVTPPSSPTGGRSRVADSDRRRSGRSTGRKKYVDDVDYNLSGQATNLIFLLFPFYKKIIDMPGGQINDPLSGKDISLPFLPEKPLSPFQTIEGLFELTRHPLRALKSTRCFRNYRETRTSCVVQGAEVPRT